MFFNTIEDIRKVPPKTWNPLTQAASFVKTDDYERGLQTARTLGIVDFVSDENQTMSDRVEALEKLYWYQRRKMTKPINEQFVIGFVTHLYGQ